MKKAIAFCVFSLFLIGCSFCSKRYYLPKAESKNDAISLSRKEEILAVVLIADRTVANLSLDHLFKERSIMETDSTYEVHYWKCHELLAGDTLPSYLGGGDGTIVVIRKETLKMEGVYGY